MSNNLDPTEEPVSEPELLASDRLEAVEEGMALCLSGGGFRAMLFHVGALWRLNQLGLLKKLKRVSSVSGGSITAGILGLNWSDLDFQGEIAVRFQNAVVEPIRNLARRTIDINSIGWGIFNPFSSIADQIADAYDKYLFSGATLRRLPADAVGPRFVINATNVKTGAVWRFSRPYMGDWRTGTVKEPDIRLAIAVAASSAFPPFLSPLTFKLPAGAFDAGVAAELTADEFRREIVLTDGGVYDNLGLETAYKRYNTILVSDGGRAMSPESEPSGDWARHSYRLIELLQRQVSSLRRRQLIEAYVTQQRHGAYWGIATNIDHYELADALPASYSITQSLADTPTRLAALDDRLQERIINWGYAVTDAAIRKHFPQDDTTPPTWPYQDSPLS